MKRLAKALRYAAAAAVCVLAATTAVDAAVAKQVRLVQVLHRHGARTSVVTYNESEICKEVPCGYLNAAGFKMMENVGTFLHSRYGADAAVVDAPFLPTEYDIDAVYTRATDVPRVLQSAEALLVGLFPASAAKLYPVIHTQTMSTDWALNSFAIPSVRYGYIDNVALHHSITNAAVDKAFPDWTVLQKVAAEAYSAGSCADYATRGECGKNVNDIVAGFIASGQDAGKPLLRENFEKLQSVTRTLFDYLFRYDKVDDMRVKQGGRGQPFLQELVENMDKTIKGTSAYKMMHYSAHDTTLSPVWGSLGDRTDHSMQPPFSQTMITELLQDAKDKSYHVRVLRGHPGQTPESNYVFGLDNTWKMRCVGADGAMYAAKDNTCPLDDFKRLVDWSKPASVEGLCYLDEESRKVVVCPDGVAAGEEQNGPKLSSACSNYRKQCPAVACGSGCVLDSTTLQCVCRGFRDSDDSSSDLSTGAVIGIAVGAFCGGALIIAAAALIICLCRRGRSGKAHPPLVNTDIRSKESHDGNTA